MLLKSELLFIRSECRRISDGIINIDPAVKDHVITAVAELQQLKRLLDMHTKRNTASKWLHELWYSMYHKDISETIAYMNDCHRLVEMKNKDDLVSSI